MIAAALSIALLLYGRMLGDLLLKPLYVLIPDSRQDLKFLLIYLKFIGVFLLTALYCAWTEKEIWNSFFSRKHGGLPGNTVRQFIFGFVTGTAVIVFCVLIAFLHGDVTCSAAGFHVVTLLAGFLCVLIQAGAEELVFRGYLLETIRQGKGEWPAVLSNACIFMLMHLLNPDITVLGSLRLFVSGVVLSLMVCRCSSLWMAIAFHTAWNYSQTFVFGLPVAGMVSDQAIFRSVAVHGSVFYDAATGVEGCLPALIAMVLLGAIILLYSEGREKR